MESPSTSSVPSQETTVPVVTPSEITAETESVDSGKPVITEREATPHVNNNSDEPEAQSVTEEAAEVATVVADAQPQITVSKNLLFVDNTVSALLFRYGFASIFLAYAVVAAFHPVQFTSLIKSNGLINPLGHAELLVQLAMVNNLLLGVLIIINRYRTLMYAWAGGWMLLMAALQVTNLLF